VRQKIRKMQGQYHVISTIIYQGKSMNLKIRYPTKHCEVVEAIRNHFNIPTKHRLRLIDNEGCDVNIDDTLQTESYQLEVLPPPGDLKKKTALLIIDIQNDFCPPHGSLAVNEGTEIIPVINKLRKNVHFDLVAVTQDWHLANHVSFYINHKDDPAAKLFTPYKLPNGSMQMLWPAHCVQGSKGAEFHSDLLLEPTDKIIRKGTYQHVDSYSGFFDNDHKTHTEMASVLRDAKITDVYVVGLAYDYCVGYSALDAKDMGLQVFVLEDATRGVAPDSTKSMKEQLQHAGVSIINSAQIPQSMHISQ